MIPPVSAHPGWTATGPPELYDPDTLYEYIDGAARMVVDHGFETLAHVSYSPASGGGTVIDLDIYKMTGDLGAYGLYTSGRPREAVAEAWGSEGYRIDNVAAAWKGAVYVHGEATTGEAAVMETVVRLVRQVASSAPGEAGPPAMVELLPLENRVTNSDRRVAKDLLGYSFLPGGILAGYAVEGEEYRLFLVEFGSNDTALAAWHNLQEAQRRQDGKPRKQAGIGENGFRIVDPGLGPGIVVRQGRYVAGVWGGSVEAVAPRRSLEQLILNVAAADSSTEPDAPE